MPMRMQKNESESVTVHANANEVARFPKHGAIGEVLMSNESVMPVSTMLLLCLGAMCMWSPTRRL